MPELYITFDVSIQYFLNLRKYIEDTSPKYVHNMQENLFVEFRIL